MEVIIGADHAGFLLKEKIKKWFDKKGIKYQDLGAFEYKEGDDYPDYAIKVAEKVAKTKNSKGILVCGSGEGMVIAANKVKGIRAVEAYDNYTAEMSRAHNDANVLAVRARGSLFFRTKRIIKTWLDTEFSGEERHMRRVKKISSYERK